MNETMYRKISSVHKEKLQKPLAIQADQIGLTSQIEKSLMLTQVRFIQDLDEEIAQRNSINYSGFRKGRQKSSERSRKSRLNKITLK